MRADPRLTSGPNRGPRPGTRNLSPHASMSAGHSTASARNPATTVLNTSNLQVTSRLAIGRRDKELRDTHPPDHRGKAGLTADRVPSRIDSEHDETRGPFFEGGL